MRHTNSARLENWLGSDQVEVISKSMKNWRGPPIAVAGVPGLVYAAPGGDFVGPIRGGYFGNLIDFVEQRRRRIFRNWLDRQKRTANAGFSSLSDLISEATAGGKSQTMNFLKNATTATTVGNAFSCFNVGVLPAASGVGGTSGTGRACVRSTTGALGQQNAAGGDYLHLIGMDILASAVSSLMLVDRIWDMTYNHASSTSTAINASNRPARYDGTTGSAYGNFVAGEITTALSATAHNLTVTYVDQDGNTAEAAAAYAAPVSAVAGRPPTVAGQWFVPLNSTDSGARYLTNIAQSTTASVTGVTTWWIAHPLAFIPQPVANVPFHYDGIYSAFNLERIYDDACLAFYTPMIATTGSITYTGTAKFVSG